MKKYKLTDNTKQFCGKTLYQIESLINFDCIQVGDKGGFIEKEQNLSHKGNAWVFNNAMICDNAVVSGDAQVGGKAIVCDAAQIRDTAYIHGHAIIMGNAQVYGNAWVWENAVVCGNSKILGHTWVGGIAFIRDNARCYGYAEICGDAILADEANVFGTAHICGATYLCGNAKVSKDKDVLCVSSIDSQFGAATAYRDKGGGINISYGCFNDTLDEFENAINKAHGDNKIGKEYKALIELIKIHFEVK